jgi:hypothetical protein
VFSNWRQNGHSGRKAVTVIAALRVGTAMGAGGSCMKKKKMTSIYLLVWRLISHKLHERDEPPVQQAWIWNAADVNLGAMRRRSEEHSDRDLDCGRAIRHVLDRGKQWLEAGSGTGCWREPTV